jgi:hypothetical protein
VNAVAMEAKRRRFRHIEAFGCLENLATVCQENVGREKEKIEERVVWEDLTAYI